MNPTDKKDTGADAASPVGDLAPSSRDMFAVPAHIRSPQLSAQHLHLHSGGPHAPRWPDLPYNPSPSPSSAFGMPASVTASAAAAAEGRMLAFSGARPPPGMDLAGAPPFMGMGGMAGGGGAYPPSARSFAMTGYAGGMVGMAYSSPPPMMVGSMLGMSSPLMGASTGAAGQGFRGYSDTPTLLAMSPSSMRGSGSAAAGGGFYGAVSPPGKTPSSLRDAIGGMVRPQSNADNGERDAALGNVSKRAVGKIMKGLADENEPVAREDEARRGGELEEQDEKAVEEAKDLAERVLKTTDAAAVATGRGPGEEGTPAPMLVEYEEVASEEGVESWAGSEIEEGGVAKADTSRTMSRRGSEASPILSPRSASSSIGGSRSVSSRRHASLSPDPPLRRRPSPNVKILTRPRQRSASSRRTSPSPIGQRGRHSKLPPNANEIAAWMASSAFFYLFAFHNLPVISLASRLPRALIGPTLTFLLTSAISLGLSRLTAIHRKEVAAFLRVATSNREGNALMAACAAACVTAWAVPRLFMTLHYVCGRVPILGAVAVFACLLATCFGLVILSLTVVGLHTWDITAVVHKGLVGIVRSIFLGRRNTVNTVGSGLKVVGEEDEEDEDEEEDDEEVEVDGGEVIGGVRVEDFVDYGHGPWGAPGGGAEKNSVVTGRPMSFSGAPMMGMMPPEMGSGLRVNTAGLNAFQNGAFSGGGNWRVLNPGTPGAMWPEDF
ncbi:hypothetical protein HK101_011177 [Irineochytrium annulatum]|nr:hypothetical protein HK101_011177 [Irineochytrium annulatum]